jgi:hypothetical protein
MNDETINGLGMLCMELLNSEAFDALTKLYSQQCAVDMLNTDGHEAKKREAIYAAYQGFEGFISLMKKFAAAAEKQTPTPQQTVGETTLDDDPSVHDIYAREID